MTEPLKPGDEIIYTPAGDATGRQPWKLIQISKTRFLIERRVYGHLRRREVDIKLLKNYTRYERE